MKKKILSVLLALVLSLSLVTAVPVGAQENISITGDVEATITRTDTLVPVAAQETITISDPVEATLIRTDTLDEVTFDIEILSENVPHGVYGVSVVFATSLDQPDFQICYAESALIGFPDIGWYYWDYDTGWGSEAAVLLETMTGFSATGDGASGEKVFSVTIPTAKLGGSGATYWYVIQVRTNCIGWYPAAYNWDSDVSAYAECRTLAPPTKADTLSGAPGKGLEEAPGLQKPFNPNSQAGDNAGKK